MAFGGLLGGQGAQLLLRIKADASQAIGEFRNLDAEQRNTGLALRAAAGVGAAAFGALATEGVRQFAALDTGMREVFTLMPGLSEQSMSQMTDDVLAFGEEYGLLSDQVVPALYEALSAGVPAENVMTFMETAAQAARGGVTSLETAVDGLTTVVNSYGAEAYSAAEASDIMFQTVFIGKTTFDEMADFMYQVVPVAATLGITLEDVGASMAALTAQGTPTRVAATQLRTALTELEQTGSVAWDSFERATGTTFPEFIAAGGTLHEALIAIGDYAEETNTPITTLFGSMEGGMAAAALSSETGSAMVVSAYQKMQGAAGSTQQAYETMAGGIGFTFDQMKAQVEGFLLAFGEAMMPTLEAVLPPLTSLLGVFADLTGALGSVSGLLPGVGAGLAALALGAGPVGAAIAGAITIGLSDGRVFSELETALAALHDRVASGASDIEDERQALIDLGYTAEDVDAYITDMTVSLENSRAVAAASTGMFAGVAAGIVGVATAQAGLEGSAEGAAGAEGEMAGALDATATAAAAALANEQALADSRRAAIDPLFAMIDAEANLITAQAAYNDLQAAGAEGTAEYEAAVRDLLERQGDYETALYDLAVSGQASIDAIEELGREAGLSEDDIADLIRRIEAYNALTIADKFFNVGIHETVTGGAAGHTYLLGGRQHGGPIPLTGMYTVGEAGPETVVLPAGADVIPHGGGGSTVIIQVAGSIWSADDLSAEIERKLVRAGKRGAESLVYG